MLILTQVQTKLFWSKASGLALKQWSMNANVKMMAVPQYLVQHPCRANDHIKSDFCTNSSIVLISQVDNSRKTRADHGKVSDPTDGWCKTGRYKNLRLIKNGIVLIITSLLTV